MNTSRDGRNQRFGRLTAASEQLSRLVLGGAHTYINGKALGNGFAVSALAGRRDLMKRGGIRHEQERVFLLPTTHGVFA